MTTRKVVRRRRKSKKKRRVLPGAVMARDLAQRIVAEADEQEKAPMFVGPAGNPDYVPHGSVEHAIMLGFDPKTGKIVFDLSSVSEKDARRFVTQRKHMLKSGVPTAPPGCPQAWNPDGGA